MKYFVTVAGKDWVVDVNDGVARTGEVEVRVRRGALAGELEFVHAGGTFRLVPQPGEGQRLVVVFEGKYLEAIVESERDRLRSGSRAAPAATGRITLESAIPGIIRRVLRKSGEEVPAGAAIVTLEAMKMENEIRSEVAGRVVDLRVEEGQVVNAGEILAVIEPT